MTPEQIAAIETCDCDSLSKRIEDALELINREPASDYFYQVLLPIKLILEGILEHE